MAILPPLLDVELINRPTVFGPGAIVEAVGVRVDLDRLIGGDAALPYGKERRYAFLFVSFSSSAPVGMSSRSALRPLVSPRSSSSKFLTHRRQWSSNDPASGIP
jgi:hypothetical protein